MSDNTENIETANKKEEWVEELFYFGNSNYPSDATYRHRGNELQIRVELNIKISAKEGSKSFYGSGNGVKEFVANYIDVHFSVHDGYKAVNSAGQPYVAPRVFLLGWKDMSSPEGWEQYNRDKKYGM